MGSFVSAFFVAKIAWNKLFPNGEAGVGGKHHVWQFRLRRNELDPRVEFRKLGVQTLPLLSSERSVGAASAAHPGINLVFDAVVIRRAKKQLTHKIDNYLSRSFVTSAP